MTNLRLQKRLAASILGCGKRRVWLDPSEVSEIANANSRQNVRKLIGNSVILKKPQAVHSRSRKHRLDAAKRKGRHTGAFCGDSCGAFLSAVTHRSHWEHAALG